jgi:hypothetical protein
VMSAFRGDTGIPCHQLNVAFGPLTDLCSSQPLRHGGSQGSGGKPTPFTIY